MLAERSVIIATTPGTRSLPVATLCKTPSHALLKSLAIVVPPISVEFDPTFFSTHRSLSESNDLDRFRGSNRFPRRGHPRTSSGAVEFKCRFTSQHSPKRRETHLLFSV